MVTTCDEQTKATERVALATADPILNQNRQKTRQVSVLPARHGETWAAAFDRTSACVGHKQSAPARGPDDADGTGEGGNVISTAAAAPLFICSSRRRRSQRHSACSRAVQRPATRQHPYLRALAPCSPDTLRLSSLPFSTCIRFQVSSHLRSPPVPSPSSPSTPGLSSAQLPLASRTCSSPLPPVPAAPFGKGAESGCVKCVLPSAAASGS